MKNKIAQKDYKPPDIFSPSFKITIIYNNVYDVSGGEPADILADEDTLKTAKAIYDQLKKLGLHVELLEINEKNFIDLLTYQTSFYFNLCYGIGSIPKTEHEIPRLLDFIGIPYTGANSDSVILTTDKISTKKIFVKLNIPTPQFEVFNKNDRIVNGRIRYPLIAKPAMEDCSLGVHNDAVVKNNIQLKKKVELLLSEYNEPILVEKFINTRELNITLIGNGDNVLVLPISEIVFGPSFDSQKKWKIVDFEAKWRENSLNYKDTIGVCPTKIDPLILKKITRYAISAYKACGCRDYARIDVRLDEKNTPYFLEINVNPGIGPGDGAVRSAKAAGYSYLKFLQKLIEITLARYN